MLEYHEKRFRDRLLDDPSNPDARLDLAWCLFLRAICAVAREEGPMLSIDSAVPQARQSNERRREDARVLLLDGLREATKVCRLSVDPAHHVDAGRLEFLIQLIGEQAIAALAHDHVDESLKRLVSDLAINPSRSEVLHDAPVPLSLSQGGAGEKTSRRQGRRTENPARPSEHNG